MSGQFDDLGYPSFEFFDAMVVEATRIKYLIYTEGGMATKSAVEDVLMNMFAGLTRFHAHGVLNEVEAQNKPIHLGWRLEWGDEPTVEEYAAHFDEVEVVWHRGNPFVDPDEPMPDVEYNTTAVVGSINGIIHSAGWLVEGESKRLVALCGAHKTPFSRRRFIMESNYHEYPTCKRCRRMIEKMESEVK